MASLQLSAKPFWQGDQRGSANSLPASPWLRSPALATSLFLHLSSVVPEAGESAPAPVHQAMTSPCLGGCADPIGIQLNHIFSSLKSTRPPPWRCQASWREREKKVIPQGRMGWGVGIEEIKNRSKDLELSSSVGSQTVDKGARVGGIPRSGVNKGDTNRKSARLFSPALEWVFSGCPLGRSEGAWT